MTTSFLDLEGIESRLAQVVGRPDWGELQGAFNSAEAIFIVGNGGNLAVADHAAVDIQRLTGKAAMAPGSGVVATSLINDSGAGGWLATWLASVAGPYLHCETPRPVLAIGLSCSPEGSSSDAICRALEWCDDSGGRAVLVTAREKQNLRAQITRIVTETNTYHAAEILALALMYQLILGSGAVMEQICESNCGDNGS